MFVAGNRQFIEVFRGRELHGLETGLRRCAAYHKHQMIRRAGRGAQRLHLLQAKFFQPLRVEQGLGFLIEVRLVGRAAALGDEQELIGVAAGGVEIDLRRQVGPGVDLVIHRERHGLGISQVLAGVGLMDPARQAFRIVTTGPDLLAFFADDDGGAGVLTERQDPVGGDLRILEHHQRDHAVVVRRSGVVENRGHLREMRRAQHEIDRLDRLRGQQREPLRRDSQHRLTFELGHRNVLGTQAFILGGIRPQGKRGLVEKCFVGHMGAFIERPGPGCKRKSVDRESPDSLLWCGLRPPGHVKAPGKRLPGGSLQYSIASRSRFPSIRPLPGGQTRS